MIIILLIIKIILANRRRRPEYIIVNLQFGSTEYIIVKWKKEKLKIKKKRKTKMDQVKDIF